MRSTGNSEPDVKDQDFDLKFKLLMVGNAVVGKSCFLAQYTDGMFRIATRLTVGADLTYKAIFRNDKKIKLEIWDTAGQERFRSITRSFYRGAAGFIVMYDISNRKSLDDARGWVAEAKQYSDDNVQVVLVGNKCDCEERRVVTYEQGQELADRLECPFFEASAKDNVNVDDAFEKLIDIICNNMRATGESETMNNVDDNAKIVASAAICHTRPDLHFCQLC